MEEPVGVMALVDSGAGGNFIDKTFAKHMGFETEKLDKPLRVYNVDGTKNKKGTISEKVVVILETKGRKTRMELLVTSLGRKQVILGYPWLVALNPDIDWRKGTLRWRNNQPESSKKAQFVANIYALLFDQETKTEDIKEDDLVISYLQGEATDTTNEVWAKSKMTRSIALAQKEEAKKPKQKVEDLVPKALHE